MNRRIAMVVLVVGLLLSACGGGDVDPEAQATEVAEVVRAVLTEVAPTPAPPPTVAPSPTPPPTAVVVDPRAIYRAVSPSVAYVETPLSQGSGVIVEGGYVVTNAHVVWPFGTVRVAFSDGSEFVDAPVVGWDLLTDLAIVGPLETSLPALEMADGESLEVGDDLFLIGYPGEEERFPQPALTRGILSRTREWERPSVTYFQADTLIAGGQSGGVLVDGMGQVIGISGFTFTEAGFGLVASAADLLPRVRGLVAGEDVSGLGDRIPPTSGSGVTETSYTLDSFWDSQIYVLNPSIDAFFEVEIEGDNDGAITIYDLFGDTLASADEDFTGLERAEGTADLEGPFFVHLEQFDESSGEFVLRSSEPLYPWVDPDDEGFLAVGETRLGNIDYPGDLDFFILTLGAGETVLIEIDSVAIDPLLSIDFTGASEGDFVTDDDGGGGLFGLNSELRYVAPESGDYFIIVQDALGSDVGGYYLSVTADEP